jgi:hypothetical protein
MVAVKDGDWFLPQVFHHNGGGFDCVQYRTGKLLFVHLITSLRLSETHSFSLNLKWYQRFRSAFAAKFPALTIAECEVWFVVREAVLGTFQPVSSSAVSSGTLTGYAQGSYKVVGMRRMDQP